MRWLAPLAIVVIFTSQANATNTQQTKQQQNTPLPNLRIDLDTYVDDYEAAPSGRWIDSVTMHRFPPGSLQIKYDGTHKLLFKQAHNQVRRFARKYASPEEPRQRMDPYQTPTPDKWWTRSWMASLPPERGGAPAAPYVHVIGKEIDWKVGPITLSNTLKISIDYVAVLKLNTDPATPSGEPNRYRLALDIKTPKTSSGGAQFKFKVKPHIRVGLHKNGDLLSFLRNITIRVELGIIMWGKQIIEGELELGYKHGDGFKIELSISLVAW